MRIHRSRCRLWRSAPAGCASVQVAGSRAGRTRCAAAVTGASSVGRWLGARIVQEPALRRSTPVHWRSRSPRKPARSNRRASCSAAARVGSAWPVTRHSSRPRSRSGARRTPNPFARARPARRRASAWSANTPSCTVQWPALRARRLTGGADRGGRRCGAVRTGRRSGAARCAVAAGRAEGVAECGTWDGARDGTCDLASVWTLGAGAGGAAGTGTGAAEVCADGAGAPDALAPDPAAGTVRRCAAARAPGPSGNV